MQTLTFELTEDQYLHLVLFLGSALGIFQQQGRAALASYNLDLFNTLQAQRATQLKEEKGAK